MSSDANAFLRVQPFLDDLKKHCYYLTKNEWDAQDLLQETLAKVHRSLQKAPDREMTKAFLRQIATNAWIDHCRKANGKEQELIAELDETVYVSQPMVTDPIVTREAFEQLADRLNARQMVLILLMDIFAFTAVETAKLLHMTVGAVKEGVKRARQRLLALADDTSHAPRTTRRDSATLLTKEAFEQFLAAFRAGDAYGICETYLRLAGHGVSVEKVSIERNRLFFSVRDPDGHLLHFFQEW